MKADGLAGVSILSPSMMRGLPVISAEANPGSSIKMTRTANRIVRLCHRRMNVRHEIDQSDQDPNAGPSGPAFFFARRSGGTN